MSMGQARDTSALCSATDDNGGPCLAPARSRGLCQKHYGRLLRNGTTTKQRAVTTDPCSAIGDDGRPCPMQVVAKGLCPRHYGRLKRTGTTDAPVKKGNDWPAILEHAATIVRSYSTRVTLRQLFYRLVSDQTLKNTKGSYQTLSSYSAEARRDGWFPDLIDLRREIHQDTYWDSPEEALGSWLHWYRRDRTEGQEYQVWLGVEKAGMVEQLSAWFGDDLGVPIIALGGYGSQTYMDEIRGAVRRDGRPAVLLYAGDFDASGEDISRDIVKRTRHCWAQVVTVALTEEQVAEYDLPVNEGKETDSRAAGFIEKYGDLVQVELDALDPDNLRQLYADALESYWDEDVAAEVLEREAEDRERLRAMADGLDDDEDI